MADIQINCFIVGMVQTNFYFLYREGSGDCVVVDPADYGERLYDELTKRGLTVRAILLTHAHYDHIWGLSALKEKCGAPVYANEAEKRVCESPQLNHSAMHGRPCTCHPDVYLRDGQEFTAADITFKMISTPGHTEGSCCYYIADGHLLLSGDTLFAESVGRSDLPTGNMADLIHSVRDKLFLLPDDTQVFPGHGTFTTIGHEKKYNVFVR